MLSDLAASVRRHDPDRFLTALFAPPDRRETLLLLYAFNHELARAREVAREPAMALIRLQWWREVVEGAVRAHEVAMPLRAALAREAIGEQDLLAMIEARECEIEQDFTDLPSFTHWLLQGPGSLAVAVGRVLGADEAALERLRKLGAGYGMAGTIRSIATNAADGRCILPAESLAAEGLSSEAVIADPRSPALHGVREVLAQEGRHLLGKPAEMPAAWLAAALPAILARRDLANPHKPATPRGFSDKLAVVSAGLRGQA